jgi:hypothetical protein
LLLVALVALGLQSKAESGAPDPALNREHIGGAFDRRHRNDERPPPQVKTTRPET